MNDKVECAAKAIFMSLYLVEESDWPAEVEFASGRTADAFRDSAKAAIEAISKKKEATA
jgi:hypothetical protein